MLHRKIGPWLFQGSSANVFYQDMLASIRLDGERSAPRGLPTTELLHVVTRINQPQRRVLSQIGRGLNPFFLLAESLWTLEGESNAAWIIYYNSQLRKYLDPPLQNFHGAYGERIRRWPWVRRLGIPPSGGHCDQLMNCYQILNAAPESRQAVIVLWNPRADGPYVTSLDRPCNDAVTFKVRAGALWMSVFNRSNDVILGLTSTNIVQFSTLQEVLASWLGVAVGPYSHYSDSLHLYDSQAVVVGAPFDIYDYVDPTPMQAQTPGLSDAYRAQLYRMAADAQQVPWVPGESLPPLGGDVCPYWASVGAALLAYSAHKRHEQIEAIRWVGQMQTPDWQVECLRFLIDRYGADEGCAGAVANIVAALPARGGLAGRQALWAYIYQSHPGVPSSC